MIIFTQKKKALQIFCATKECGCDFEKWCFLQNRWLPTNTWHKQKYDWNGRDCKWGLLYMILFYLL